MNQAKTIQERKTDVEIPETGLCTPSGATSNIAIKTDSRDFSSFT